MKRKALWISIIGILLIGFVCLFCYRHYIRQKQIEQKKHTGLVSENFPVQDIKHQCKNIYEDAYQTEADNQLQNMRNNNSYTIEDPLLVWNPYGTNTGSFYYYGVSEQDSYVVCEVTCNNGSVIKHRLKNDSDSGVTKTHEYLITGLAPGLENHFSLAFYDAGNNLIHTYQYTVTLKKDKQIPAITKVEKGNSKSSLTDGLFAVLGHDKSKAKNIYYYDNNGICRGKTPLNDYRTDRILTIDGKLVYSYSLTDIAFVNRLGKVEKTLSLGKYELHHDFMYDEKRNELLCLVNDTDKDTIEDVLISVNIETGKIKKLVDFEKMMKSMRKRSVQRKGGKNTYGGTELDWLHLNSLDMINNKDAVFSSREESVIIKINNIYENPSIDYLIHSGSLYKGTKYEKLLLKQKGNFVGHAGQHTITVEHDASLPNGQYYLFMYNNNFGSAKTLPQFDWSLYPGVGTYRKGTASYFCKYLVDENQKTYELVQQFSVPYSSVVSGVNYIGNNITFSSGMDHTYGEYDKQGNMICTYTYAAKRYAYRVIKYDFTDVYYEKETTR